MNGETQDTNGRGQRPKEGAHFARLLRLILEESRGKDDVEIEAQRTQSVKVEGV